MGNTYHVYVENQDEDGDLIISDDAAETLNNLIALGGAASTLSMVYKKHLTRNIVQIMSKD